MLRRHVSGIFSERELYVVVRPSVCRLSSVCLSLTFVHPTQTIEIIGCFYAIWYIGHLLTT